MALRSELTYWEGHAGARRCPKFDISRSLSWAQSWRPHRASS